MENAYVQTFTRLRATSLSQEAHEGTCGYWFTITAGAIAHTAFKTRGEMDTWLAERGLRLEPLGWRFDEGRHVDCPLQDAGTTSTVAIVGGYHRVSHRDVAAFDALEPILTTRVMDNAEMTLAKVTEAEGVRSIHHMNVNYRERKAIR